MKLFDGMTIPEEWIAILWEHDYFRDVVLKTPGDDTITIISTGVRNHDSGPDFKDISIKINDEILQGDLEIHRTAGDWFVHGHQNDPAYNNVILHLIFGERDSDSIPVRHDRHPIPIQVFTDIPDQKIIYFISHIKQSHYSASSLFNCYFSHLDDAAKTMILDRAGLERILLKSKRFADLRSFFSWNQIIYMGFMESLGYSKNQRPFLKLAQMVPFETLQSQCREESSDMTIIKIQALLFGTAGLLPSQDTKLMSVERNRSAFISELESTWKDINSKIGYNPMDKSLWRFFRLRPNNFPTRRIAGASYVLERFMNKGILETCVRMIDRMFESPHHLMQELETLVICRATGYWENHYLLTSDDVVTSAATTLIGRDRAIEIIINVIVPCIIAYSGEAEDKVLYSHALNLIKNHPVQASNSITREMSKTLMLSEMKLIRTTLRQQGLIHLYKSYCRRGECEFCVKEIEGYAI